MNRWAAWLLVGVFVLGGCSAKGGSQPASSTPPITPAPVAPAPVTPAPVTPAPATPSKPPEQKAPAPAPAFDEKALRPKIAEAIKQKGARVDADGPRLFPLQLRPVPQGYSQLIAAAADMKLFLVAVSDTGTLFLIGQWENTMINMAKLQVSSTADHITVWSQKPYGATEMRAELSWNGNTLQVVESHVSDPTINYFGAKQKLIDSKDIDGLMALGGVKDILYPQSDGHYWSQPRHILLLSYEVALSRYRAGNLPLALQTLRYGAGEYQTIWGDLLASEPAIPPSSLENVLPLAERIPIANDLAFFLAESGKHQEALLMLQRVVVLAPDRTVAYLNLADVEWQLGQKAAAKVHYQKYLDLLGPANRSTAPERVLQRLNG